MSIIIQKYGGTSVESKEKLKFVIEKIKIELNKKNKVVVVVSAQGKTTENLLKLSEEYGENINGSKELDLLLATGEIKTATLLTMMLKKEQINAVALTGSDAGILTNSNYGNAEILEVYPSKIKEELKHGKVVVVTGFQGVDKYGNVTTLGRGGSDLTATTLANVLKAERCEIYTDVDGIYTADPKICNAENLEKISLREILELSASGAKVMQAESILEAMKNDCKLVVKNTINNTKGTEIIKNEIYKDDKIKITSKNKLAKITIVGKGYITQKGKLEEILSELENIKIYMIQISEISVSILIEEKYEKQIISNLNNRINKK